MSQIFTCSYCGKNEPRSKSYDPTPNGWIKVRKGIFLVLYFCSHKCKNQYTD